MQTINASGFVCLSAVFAPHIKYMVTGESVIHFPSENRPVHVWYIPVGTSHKQKWYKCIELS